MWSHASAAIAQVVGSFVRDGRTIYNLRDATIMKIKVKVKVGVDPVAWAHVVNLQMLYSCVTACIVLKALERFKVDLAVGEGFRVVGQESFENF